MKGKQLPFIIEIVGLMTSVKLVIFSPVTPKTIIESTRQSSSQGFRTTQILYLRHSSQQPRSSDFLTSSGIAHTEPSHRGSFHRPQASIVATNPLFSRTDCNTQEHIAVLEVTVWISPRPPSQHARRLWTATTCGLGVASMSAGHPVPLYLRLPILTFDSQQQINIPEARKSVTFWRKTIRLWRRHCRQR